MLFASLACSSLWFSSIHATMAKHSDLDFDHKPLFWEGIVVWGYRQEYQIQ